MVFGGFELIVFMTIPLVYMASRSIMERQGLKNWRIRLMLPDFIFHWSALHTMTILYFVPNILMVATVL